MIAFSREYGKESMPVWQGIGKDIQLAQGGFTLSATGLSANTVIPAGTPLVISESARTASIMGYGVAQAVAGGSDTAYKILKGHTLKVGDYAAVNVAGGKAYAITAIDTSNADYDEITVGTSLGAAAVGDLIYASTATGASASAFPAVNALLYDDTLSNVGESVSAVIRGTVYARRVAYSAGLAALTGLKNIIYSQSK